MLRVEMTISPARPSRRTTRAMEEPIRPMPIRAMRSNIFSVIFSVFQEFRECGDYAAIGFFGAYRHTQRVGKPVCRNAPENIAAPRQILLRRLGGMLPVFQKVNESEVCFAGRDAKAELRQLLGRPF